MHFKVVVSFWRNSNTNSEDFEDYMNLEYIPNLKVLAGPKFPKVCNLGFPRDPIPGIDNETMAAMSVQPLIIGSKGGVDGDCYIEFEFKDSEAFAAFHEKIKSHKGAQGAAKEAERYLDRSKTKWTPFHEYSTDPAKNATKAEIPDRE